MNENTLRDVSRKISEGIKPQIIPHISLELIGDKKIIKVYAKGDNVSYYAFDKYYSRSFDEDKQLSSEMLKALYISNDIKIDNDKIEDNLGLKTADNKYNLMAELLADSNDLSIKVVTFAETDKSVMLKRTDYGGKCLLLSVNNVL